MTERRLSDLLPGEVAVIKKIICGEAIGKRLADMGLVRGTKVHMQRYALLRDPVHINIGYDLALRRAEAEYVIIDNIQKNENQNHQNRKRKRHRHGQRCDI